MSKIRAEYIWIDGHFPTAKLRSKTKIVDGPIKKVSELLMLGDQLKEKAKGHFPRGVRREINTAPWDVPRQKIMFFIVFSTSFVSSSVDEIHFFSSYSILINNQDGAQ